MQTVVSTGVPDTAFDGIAPVSQVILFDNQINTGYGNSTDSSSMILFYDLTAAARQD